MKSGKTGLVMEGGAMRGMFTCGVIDVFMENGIEFDASVGVSAGAAFGCNIMSRQIGRAVRYNKRFCRDKRYASIDSLIKTGDLYNADFCYTQIPDTLDVFDTDAFSENPMEFYVVCTDVETGKPVYHRCMNGGKNDVMWIRASASMPLASRIVEIDGYKLLDGGAADSIPLKFLEEKGCTKNIVILTQPIGYRKKKNQLMPLIKAKYRKYPGLVRAMAKRHIMYNDETRYVRSRELSGDAFVIRPAAKLDIGRIEKDEKKIDKAYLLGRETALSCLDKVKEFLRK